MGTPQILFVITVLCHSFGHLCMPSHTLEVMPWLSACKPEFIEPDLEQSKLHHTHSSSNKIKRLLQEVLFTSFAILLCAVFANAAVSSEPSPPDFWLRLGYFQVRQHWHRPWFAQAQAPLVGYNHIRARYLNVDSGWISWHGCKSLDFILPTSSCPIFYFLQQYSSLRLNNTW